MVCFIINISLATCRAPPENHLLDSQLKDVRSVVERSIGWLKTNSKMIAGPIYCASHERLLAALLVYSGTLNNQINCAKTILVDTHQTQKNKSWNAIDSSDSLILIYFYRVLSARSLLRAFQAQQTKSSKKWDFFFFRFTRCWWTLRCASSTTDCQ